MQRRYAGLLVLLFVGLAAVLGHLAATAAVETVIYEKQSEFNAIVVTEDLTGLRTLWFEKDGAKQSVGKPGDVDTLHLAYAKAMPAGLTLVPAPKRILVIGLGGGTLPMFFHKHFPKATIDAVDIDPEVITVAKRFFGFREDATLHAHAMDGRRFIEDCREPYDMILLDAYGPDNIPYALATKEFLVAVRRAVSRSGVVVSNVWSRDANPLYDSMVKTYHDVFGDLYVIDAKNAGNRVLVALSRTTPLTADDLARRAKPLQEKYRFQFDLAAIIREGFEHPSRNAPEGEVLHDKK